MLYGKELVESIRKRCKIQPGMLVVSRAAGENEIPKVAVVMEVSPACEFTGTMREPRATSFTSVSQQTARQCS